MSEQTLKMAPHLMNSVLDGSKKITIRKGVRSFLPNSICDIVSADGNFANRTSVVIDKVYVATFENIPLEDIIADGGTCHDDMLEEMKQFYPDMEANTGCTVIKWK